MSLDYNTHLGSFVCNAALGKIGKNYYNSFQKFLLLNGPEWTVNRFKSILNASLHLKNGDRESARKVYQANSISYHKGTMLPKGSAKRVVLALLTATSKPSQKRVLAVLRVPTTVYLKSLSPKQEAKIIDNITSPFTGNKTIISNVIQLIPTLGKTSKSFFGEVDARTNLPHRIKQSLVDDLKVTSRYYSPVSPHGFHKHAVLSSSPVLSLSASLYTTAYVPPLLDNFGVTPGKLIRNRIRYNSPEVDFSTIPVGRVSVIQEAGCKARAVAVPTAWIQLSFKPLHVALEKAILHYFSDESCLHDQEKGIEDILFTKYRYPDFNITSIDLSAATDRMPLDPQIAVLEAFGLNTYATSLKELVSKDWVFNGSTIKYTVGQPMGLYGSFPLFHLTNLLLCEMVTQAVMAQSGFINGVRGPNSSPYRVIGDDVIFSDDRVAIAYRNLLTELGVEISPLKSFSGKVSEFAGFITLPSRIGYSAFRPYKYPNSKFVNNPIQFLSSIGSRLNNLSPYWSRLYSDYHKYEQRRTLSLTPISDESNLPMSNSYRLDNAGFLATLQQVTRMDGVRVLKPEPGVHPVYDPLFSEKTVLNRSGYSPDALKSREYTSKQLHKIALNSDPLMKQAREERSSPSLEVTRKLNLFSR